MCMCVSPCVYVCLSLCFTSALFFSVCDCSGSLQFSGIFPIILTSLHAVQVSGEGVWSIAVHSGPPVSRPVFSVLEFLTLSAAHTPQQRLPGGFFQYWSYYCSDPDDKSILSLVLVFPDPGASGLNTQLKHLSSSLRFTGRIVNPPSKVTGETSTVTMCPLTSHTIFFKHSFIEPCHH